MDTNNDPQENLPEDLSIINPESRNQKRKLSSEELPVSDDSQEQDGQPEKRAKLDSVVDLPEDLTTRKESDQESLDEGEIVDDDDEDEPEKIVVKTETENQEIPIQTKNSTNNDDDKFEEGECKEQKYPPESMMLNVKKEISDEIASNYSDWTESEDELLKADTGVAENDNGDGGDNITCQHPQQIKTEPIDNDHESTLVTTVKEDIDLEAISDDDFDSLADDTYDKSGGDLERLVFNQKEDGSTCPTPDKELEDISILDTLKIDWASLIKQEKNQSSEIDDVSGGETKPDIATSKKDKKARSEQFRRENSSWAMLARVGFSHQYAGPKLTRMIQEYLEKNSGGSERNQLHPMPALHSFFKNKQNQNILGATGVVMSGDKDLLFQESVHYPFL